MKRCPKCHTTYPNPGIRFCVKDGERLVSISDDDEQLDLTLQLPAGGDTQRLDDSGGFGAGGVWKANSDQFWLDENRELQVCLVQPDAVKKKAILNDAPRPQSLALAGAIFGKEDGEAPLARWFGQQPGVVLFPEYAFGSRDFSALNDLIKGFPGRLIVCAGFGIVRGNSLRELLNSCKPTWHKGASAIEPLGNYNAGWCWIHEGENRTRCFIFLKNFLDQKLEVPLVTPGNSIFRLDAKDLVFYPLICADLISDQPEGPIVRIENSLPTTDDRLPDLNKKVIVAALLYTKEPYHSLWHPAINQVVQLHESNGGLITVNQPFTGPPPDVEADQWRCLSGGFISRAIMSGNPLPLLQPVRYVRTDSASGLILRSSGGVSCGSFRWVDKAHLGRNVWVPHVRRFWKKDKLEESRESAVLHEFKRYVDRHRSKIVGLFDPSATSMIESSLDRVAKETQENRVHPRLWSRLVTGVEEPPATMNFDSMDEVSGTLDFALGGFACVEEATGGQLLTDNKDSGQLLWEEREILVWNSHTSNTSKMYHLLQTFCLKRQGERMLIVLGKGTGGYREAKKVVAKKVSPDRLTDISTNRDRGNRSFTQERVRHVFWCPLQKLENILDKRTDVEVKKRAIRQMLAPKTPARN